MLSVLVSSCMMLLFMSSKSSDNLLLQQCQVVGSLDCCEERVGGVFQLRRRRW
jgi:hypothetical protein